MPEKHELLRGLDLHTIRPELSHAERELVAARSKLDGAREYLGAVQRALTELPPLVANGEKSIDELARAEAQAKVQPLVVAQCERALADAQAAVLEEQKAARRVLEAEVARRRVFLVTAVAEIAPALEEIKALEFALGQALGHDVRGLNVTWPLSNAHEVGQANMRMAASHMGMLHSQATANGGSR